MITHEWPTQELSLEEFGVEYATTGHANALWKALAGLPRLRVLEMSLVPPDRQLPFWFDHVSLLVQLR